MLKLNGDYSDYTDETDAEYPEGKAINASSSESFDGTPLLAEFMNDINASHIAMYEKAYGTREGITGIADTQKASQFVDAIAKYTDDKLQSHVDEKGLSDNVHGATSSAEAGQIACRDTMGNIGVGSAVEDADAVNLAYLNDVVDTLSPKEGSSSLATCNQGDFGTAATKTAGTAAGNVPLIGTALGTTNNNIVVTDANGKLKPSGTTIGSAAGKTAGTAAGNVPLIGTALGTTNNKVVVTDANGNLKPGSYTLGAAAAKGVDTAASTSSVNLITTKAATGIANGGVCATAAGTQAKTVTIPGFVLFTGAVIRVLFSNACTVANPTLNVSGDGSTYTGAKTIVGIHAGAYTKTGSTVGLGGHSGKWRGGSSYTTEVWQAKTILELMYDGTYWVICGNPTLESYNSASVSYEVKANGLIEQSGSVIKYSTDGVTVTLPVKYSDKTYSFVFNLIRDNWSGFSIRANFTVNTVVLDLQESCDGFKWFASGY